MAGVKNDDYFLSKIIKDIKFLIIHTSNINYEEFVNNEILQDCVMFRLIQISENVKQLSMKIKEKNKIIPWKSIIGLKNRIVHDYGEVNFRIIYDTVKVDIKSIEEMRLAIIN